MHVRFQGNLQMIGPFKKVIVKLTELDHKSKVSVGTINKVSFQADETDNPAASDNGPSIMGHLMAKAMGLDPVKDEGKTIGYLLTDQDAVNFFKGHQMNVDTNLPKADMDRQILAETARVFGSPEVENEQVRNYSHHERLKGNLTELRLED